MKIRITDFGKRHFDDKFGGTKILDTSIEKVEGIINSQIVAELLYKNNQYDGVQYSNMGNLKLMNGYAPFCKLLAIPNFTNARVGSLPITLENYQYLRSGYSARTESELPVFSRWFELPVNKPMATYLIFVLYSKEQLEKEAKERNEEFEMDAEWGVVAILGQSHNGEEPMKPETMLRNALGTKEGGSGVPLVREKYLESVKFWNENATVK